MACEGAVHRHRFDFFLGCGLSGVGVGWGGVLSSFLLLWFLQLQLSGGIMLRKQYDLSQLRECGRWRSRPGA